MELSYILARVTFNTLPCDRYILSTMAKFENNDIDAILSIFSLMNCTKYHKKRLSKQNINYEFKFNNGFTGIIPANIYECYMRDLESCNVYLTLSSIKNLDMNEKSWNIITYILLVRTTDFKIFTNNKLNLSTNDLIIVVNFLKYSNIKFNEGDEDEDDESNNNVCYGPFDEDETNNFWHIDVIKVNELNQIYNSLTQDKKIS